MLFTFCISKTKLGWFPSPADCFLAVSLFKCSSLSSRRLFSVIHTNSSNVAFLFLFLSEPFVVAWEERECTIFHFIFKCQSVSVIPTRELASDSCSINSNKIKIKIKKDSNGWINASAFCSLVLLLKLRLTKFHKVQQQLSFEQIKSALPVQNFFFWVVRSMKCVSRF